MKIAIVHDALLEFGGAERVLVSLKKMFPDAVVYTAFYAPKNLGHHSNKFKEWNIKTSWLNSIPLIKRFHSPLRFLYPWIWESFDFSQYDLVISSCNHFCKGIVTKPNTTHICYIHHPPRYLYNYETAMNLQKYWPVKLYANIINHPLRLWDYVAAQRPNYYISNSEETAKRVQKFYRRESTVIYPPVSIPPHIDLDHYPSDPYYITVSRFGRAKHIEVLIQAANKMPFKLKIIGTGKEAQYLKSIAGSTVEFLGSVTDDQFQTLLSNAQAFLFAAKDEEFGIAPIEGMGYGLPVIAYRSGGLIETVDDGNNGFLYNQLTADSLIEKMKLLESLSRNNYLHMKKNARKTAEHFSEERFQTQIVDLINKIVLHPHA